MTLSQLMYIVAVNKYRHFGTAAEKSFVTQPTLSMQVQKLEDELGVKLFDRSKSPVVPTPIGIDIIKKAEQILAGEKEIEDMARSGGELIQGTYRVGVVSTVAPYLLPLFWKSFLTSYPGVSLIFEEGLTRDIVQGIADDRLDAGIIASPPDQPQIFEKDLFYEPFVGYVGCEHPFAEPEPCRKVRLIYSRKYLENTLISTLEAVILQHLPDELRHSQKRLIIK